MGNCNTLLPAPSPSAARHQHSHQTTVVDVQAAATTRSKFKGSVVFVKTTAFARPTEESPNKGYGHHWFGNAESYFLIGDAFTKAMKELIIQRD